MKVDDRWTETALEMMAGYKGESKPSRTEVIEQTQARVIARFGQGAVTQPSRATAFRVLEDLERNAGSVDNGGLEARADVLTFTSAPLPEALEILGPVSARLRIRASNPYHDVFARLCDLDPHGRSRNTCDGLVRHQPGDSPAGETTITVPMSSTAHRFSTGHRIRLQVSCGAHPRYARNTGTTDPQATATRLVPTDIQILHDAEAPCVLTLPAADAYSPADAPARQRAAR